MTRISLVQEELNRVDLSIHQVESKAFFELAKKYRKVPHANRTDTGTIYHVFHIEILGLNITFFEGHNP
jgi:hypothetical protein